MPSQLGKRDICHVTQHNQKKHSLRFPIFVWMAPGLPKNFQNLSGFPYPAYFLRIFVRIGRIWPLLGVQITWKDPTVIENELHITQTI